VIAFPLAMHLYAFVQQHGLGLVLNDVDFKLRSGPDRVVSPDAGYVSTARLDPGRDRSKAIPVAPDLAVELFSPTDRESDVADKVGEYLVAGSLRVCVVRPKVQTVTVHRPGDEPRTYGLADTLSSDDAGFTVPGFELPASQIFQA
jgi:Uma2 family endonuclease